jgi:hypothetical protein
MTQYSIEYDTIDNHTHKQCHNKTDHKKNGRVAEHILENLATQRHVWFDLTRDRIASFLFHFELELGSNGFEVFLKINRVPFKLKLVLLTLPQVDYCVFKVKNN